MKTSNFTAIYIKTLLKSADILILKVISTQIVILALLPTFIFYILALLAILYAIKLKHLALTGLALFFAINNSSIQLFHQIVLDVI